MSEPASKQEPAAPTATIYDLGYKRYVGKRKPQSTRWWVVSRQVITHAMKSWWRLKLWIGCALLITVVVAAIMVVFRTDTFRQVGELEPVVRRVDGIVVNSLVWFQKVAFLLTLTVGAGIIATDRRSGAFTFYFSRPVRPLDYVTGKLVGLFIVQAMVLLIPFVVLAAVRIGVSKDQAEMVANLQYLPKAILNGVLASMVYASVALAFSSMMASPRVNVAIWAVVYIIGIGIPGGVGMATENWDLQAIDFPTALLSLSHYVYDYKGGPPGDGYPPGYQMPSVTASIISVAGYIIASVMFAWWRIREVAYRGIGGG